MYDTDAWKSEIWVVSRKSIFEERANVFLPKDTLTIRCRLRKGESESIESEEKYLCSTVGVRRKVFVWPLKGFRKGWTDAYPYLFPVRELYGRLEFIASIKSEVEERIVIKVRKIGGEAIFATLSISLLDAYGKEKKLMSDAFLFEESEKVQVWQSPPLISQRELAASKSRFMPNDTLSLKCEFAASLGTVNESEIFACPREFILSNDFPELRLSKCKVNDKLPSGSLQSDLRRILDTGSLSDLKLKVDSDVFPVHKALLGARSPAFIAMLSNDCKEKSSGEVLISDIDADTVRQFLIYLYTDTVDIMTMENATKLYFAADKYGILCLKEICESFLMANLSSSTVCEVLLLADLHQDEELKVAAQDFINKHECEVLRSDDWQELEKMNHLLALETLRKICLEKSSK